MSICVITYLPLSIFDTHVAMIEHFIHVQMRFTVCLVLTLYIISADNLPYYIVDQRLLTCGSLTPGGPRLFRKLNNFSQQINEVYTSKKSKI
jgi:hypothetical protein